MATARLTDVGARDPHPLVISGRRQHPLEQIAVAGLQLVLFAQGVMCLGNAIGKFVANSLQLLEPRDSRFRKAGGDRGVQGKSGKGLSAEPGKLVLEAADLTAQLRTREALVASHSKRRQRVSIE